MKIKEKSGEENLLVVFIDFKSVLSIVYTIINKKNLYIYTYHKDK